MRKLFYIFILISFAKNLPAQVPDTCYINDTIVYHVRNQLANSLLYWEISGGKILSENPNKTDSIVVLWNIEGNGELSVYEKTENNCKGNITSIEISVIEKDFGKDFEIILQIPNIITPNNDGKNDRFKISANQVPEIFELTIYSRTGAKIFETKDILDSWDGKNKDRLCSPGVYYYIIKYQNKNKIEFKKGFIHVVR